MIWLIFSSVLAQAAPAEDFLGDLELFKSRSLLIRSEQSRLEADHTSTLSRVFQITPSVSVGVGKTQTKIWNDSPATTTTSISDYWRASADWNLFRGFSDYHAWRSAQREEEAQKYQVRNKELSTELDGSKAVFRWLYLRDSGAAQGELLKLKQETMRIGRDRYAQGKIPLQEVTKMELDLALQQNAVRESEINAAENEAAYKAFFVDSLRTKAWPFTENQETALSDGEGSMATKLLKERASSLNSAWLSSRALHLPSIDLALSYRESPLKTPNTGTFSGTIELSLPLWSRFETAARSGQAYSSFVSAESDAEIAEREESLKRDFLKKKIALSSASMREARMNLEKSDKLYRDMLRSFQLGRLSTNDLFQEQNRKISAELSYAGSRLAFHESVMEACALWGLPAKTCLR